MYSGKMDADFVLGDFAGPNPACESVALVRHFMGSAELRTRLAAQQNDEEVPSLE